MSLLRGLMLRSSLLLLFVASACSVGAVDGAGGADANLNDPNAMSFNAMVKPITTARCTNTGCHQPGGTQPVPGLNEYANLQANYKIKPGTNSKLVSYLPDGAVHQTTTFFDATEKATVAAWLDSITP